MLALRVMFTVRPDGARRLLDIRFERAFWDHDTVDRFVEACVAGAVALDCELGTQRTVVDLSNAILQSQSVVARLQKFMADPIAGRIALVAMSPLGRMQARRLATREDIRLFDDLDAAMRWLDLAGPAAAPHAATYTQADPPETSVARTRRYAATS